MRARLLALLLAVFVILPAWSGELEPSVVEDIAALADDGDSLFGQGRYAEAIDHYRQALGLLPRPVSQWQVCSVLMVAIGDTYFAAGQFQQARRALELSLACYGGGQDPFAQLRLGQAALELGECELAADALTRALALAGYEIFEHEHPKYLDFAANILSLEQNGQLSHC